LEPGHPPKSQPTKSSGTACKLPPARVSRTPALAVYLILCPCCPLCHLVAMRLLAFFQNINTHTRLSHLGVAAFFIISSRSTRIAAASAAILPGRRAEQSYIYASPTCASDGLLRRPSRLNPCGGTFACSCASCGLLLGFRGPGCSSCSWRAEILPRAGRSRPFWGCGVCVGIQLPLGFCSHVLRGVCCPPCKLWQWERRQGVLGRWQGQTPVPWQGQVQCLGLLCRRGWPVLLV
jgi:hypothetical protein